MEFTTGLKKNADFRTVYQEGRSAGNHLLVLYVRRREDENSRIGISVSKKVGNSVVRHRLKRLIKEAYRLNEKRFVGGLDMIFIARPGAREKSFSEIERAVLHLGRKLNVQKNEGMSH